MDGAREERLANCYTRTSAQHGPRLEAVQMAIDVDFIIEKRNCRYVCMSIMYIIVK